MAKKHINKYSKLFFIREINANQNISEVPPYIYHNGKLQNSKDNHTLAKMWSKGSSPSLLIGVQACTTTLEINLVVSQKTGNRSTSRPSCSTPGHIPRRNFTIPQGYLLKHVHSSFICNSQKLETT